MAEGDSNVSDDNDPSEILSNEPVNESDYWLERKPILSVVCAVIRTIKWRQLGIQLELDIQKLNEINMDNPITGLKRTKMFEMWLETQPQATNRQLLKALRLKEIAEDTLAEAYEERIKTDPSTLTTRHNFTPNQG